MLTDVSGMMGVLLYRRGL